MVLALVDLTAGANWLPYTSGGKFCIIDFALFHRINSGIRRRMGVITAVPVLHSGSTFSGRWPPFCRRNERVCRSAASTAENEREIWYRGIRRCGHPKLDIIRRYSGIRGIPGGDSSTRQDLLAHAYRSRRKKKAQYRTAACMPVLIEEVSAFHAMAVDEER